MKKFLFWTLMAILAVLAGYQAAQAAPFLVCDPQAGATFYRITGDGYFTADIPAQTDGSLRADVGPIAPGVHNIQVFACASGENWPTGVCSPTATPFSFTKPSAPGAPTNMRLAP